MNVYYSIILNYNEYYGDQENNYLVSCPILSREPWKHFVISADSRSNSTRQILLSKLREVKVIIQGQTAGKRWSKNLNLRGLTPKLAKCQKNYSTYLTYPSSFTPHSNLRSKPFLPHFTRMETGT